MEEEEFVDNLVEKFELKNDLTQSIKIWVGHAKLGYRNRPNIEDAKKILLGMFENFIPEETPTPEKILKSLAQWENFHPFQKVRELDQPLYYTIKDKKITVAVIWPWQMKKGVASLMLYEGRVLN